MWPEVAIFGEVPTLMEAAELGRVCDEMDVAGRMKAATGDESWSRERCVRYAGETAAVNPPRDEAGAKLATLLARLDAIAGETAEGNVWRAASLNATTLEKKRAAMAGLASSRRPLKRIAEIGFNAGHSAATWLTLFPEASVTALDICAHNYTVPAYEWLRGQFAHGRLSLTCGPSAETARRIEDTFDMVFVDGGHLFDVALWDLENFHGLAEENAVVIVDDCVDDVARSIEDTKGQAPFVPHVALAWRAAVDKGLISPTLPPSVGAGIQLCAGHYRAPHKKNAPRVTAPSSGSPFFPTLDVAVELEAPPDAGDVVCYDGGLDPPTCVEAKPGSPLPRLRVQDLGGGVGRVRAWIQNDAKRPRTRSHAAVAYVWNDPSRAMAFFANNTDAVGHYHLGIAREQAGLTTWAAASFGVAMALGDARAAPALARVASSTHASSSSSCAAESSPESSETPPTPPAPDLSGVRLVLYAGKLQDRGVTLSLYDYADLALTHLKVGAVFVLYGRSSSVPAIRRFGDRFGYDNIAEVPSLKDPVSKWLMSVNLALNRMDATHFYSQRYGYNDGRVPSWNSIVTGVHCVFDATQPHADAYARISHAVPTTSSAPVVPYVVRRPDPDLEARAKDRAVELRRTLGIPETALVFARYGGESTFSVPFARKAVDAVAKESAEAAAKDPDDEEKETIYFIFMNTQAWRDNATNVVFLPGSDDELTKRAFVHAADAMLHARLEGETFGLAVAEFSTANKPVVTWDPRNDTNYARFHIDVLGDRGFYYDDYYSLIHLLFNFRYFRSVKAPPRTTPDFDAYKQFAPDVVMPLFRDTFLLKR